MARSLSLFLLLVLSNILLVVVGVQSEDTQVVLQQNSDILDIVDIIDTESVTFGTLLEADEFDCHSQIAPNVVDSYPLEFDDETLSIADSDGLVIVTEFGRVKGSFSNRWTRIRQFQGIPYAKPPVGERRWTMPTNPDPWQPQVLKTMRKPPACMQIIPLIQSEDCLFLEIYAPVLTRLQDDKPLPVLVWIHGGGWLLGSGEMLGIQDPSYMVHHRDVIVVQIQYRLGPLGFLVTADEIAGNFGLADQQFAIDWVRRNIRAFGGDPNNIILWGESAGAMSIGFHLTNPQPFSDSIAGVILESSILGVRFKQAEEAAVLGEKLCQRLQCSPCTRDCLVKRPGAIVTVIRMPVFPSNDRDFLADILTWAPVVDGIRVRGQPQDLIQSGDYNKVPVMMGFQEDESSLAIAAVDSILRNAFGSRLLFAPIYTAAIKLFFKSRANDILALYPPSHVNVTQNTYNLIHLTTDFMALCPGIRTARAFAQDVDTYFYTFEFGAKFLPTWFLGRCREDFACHSMEMPYVFHSLQYFPFLPKFTENEHDISHALTDYFSDFSRHEAVLDTSSDVGKMGHDMAESKGTPGFTRPEWLKLSAIRGRHQLQHLDIDKAGDITVKSTKPRMKFCEFWDEYELLRS
eukprot:Partr_v1_DN27188_c0_g1_i1_m15608 putative ACEtylcholinesterase